ncbi:MAG: hypothetical protein K0R09_981 [Clostridiales bacterium]|jgi:uncharacterized membrane-anchored protein|nr:hypothetical protein [Clostridiales bacterium]
MLCNYRKLSITKELKNYSGIDCIIINQNIIDFAITEMILDKKVKKIINCVDYIYQTKGCGCICKNGIEMVYLEAKHFKEFENCGIVSITRHEVYYNKKCFNLSNPDSKAIDSLIEGFVWNTIRYMDKEKELINTIEISGRTKNIKPISIIISRGEYGKEDIRYLKKIIKEENPSIICVDGGCDIALKYKLLPDMVIGDMDSISRTTIQLTDNFVIHKYLNGICPGLIRIPENKNIGFIKCFGTSEDAAILYCIKKGSSKIYTLGFHINTVDYIEKGRKGMASSLLIRLYYGHIITDIKGVARASNRMLYLVSSAAILLIILYISFFTKLAIRVFK